MARIYQDGWEYSRRRVLEYKGREAGQLDKLKKKEAWEDPKLSFSPEDIGKIIDMVRQGAVEVLESRSIPGAPLVYRCKNSGRWKPAWMMPDKGPMPRKSEVMNITDHVKSLGKERDSPEDLAARILLKIYELEHAKNEKEIICFAFWCGYDVAMGTVYNSYTTKKSKGGKNSRNPTTVWGPVLAKYMNTQKPGISGEQVFKRLEYGPLTIKGWTFTITPEGQIQATRDEKSSPLTVNYFYREYLKPLQKKG